MANAQLCNELILVMLWVEGCSKASPISIDPSEVPDGAELWLPKLPKPQVFFTTVPVIGIGLLNWLLTNVLGEFPDLLGEQRGPDALADEDDTSMGGPGTRT